MTRFRHKIFLLLAGLIVGVILLESGLRASGFVLLTLQEQRNSRALAKKEAYRILCLGESTTFQQYPRYLQEALDSYNSGIMFSVIDRGRPGTNTSLIARGLEQDIRRFKPHIVVTMMGINDMAGRMPAQTAEESLNAFSPKRFRIYKLLQWFQAQASGFARRLNRIYASSVEEQLAQAVNYINVGDLKAADRLLQQVLLAHLDEPVIFFQVAECYSLENSLLPRALEVLQKGANLFPKDPLIMAGFGEYYEILQQHSLAQEYLNKAIALMPDDPFIFLFLSRAYINGEDYAKAEKLLNGILKTRPAFFEAYIELGWIYLYQENYPAAEKIFLKAREYGGNRREVFGGLYILYTLWGKDEQMLEAYKGLIEIPSWFFYNSITKKNYRTVRDILRERGITFVAASYPLMGEEALRKIFKDAKGIVFVDNCAPFRIALKENKYQNIFSDRFAGFFGHCTEEGNRILAQNIARAIMRDVLHVISE